MTKIIRTATVSMSLDILLKGQLTFLNQYYDTIAISGEDDYLTNVRSREKVKTIPVELQRQISPIKDFVSLIKLYKVFKKEKPLIVHSITPKAGLLSMTAAYFAGVPIRIHTFTGLIFPTRSGSMQKLLIMMDKILCQFATNIFPEGEGVKKDLLHYKITKKFLKVLANGNLNGIDTKYFDKNSINEFDKQNLRNQINIKITDFVFIFVGRLVADKGINELVTAFTKLSEETANCKLILVGPFEDDLDPLKKETKNYITHNSNIISVGFQEDVRPWFSISNALVFPSYREGFPNVVLQAGAMELPSIVTDINGSNEIIENNKNGIIIPVKDENAIFDAMKKMINNPEFTNQLKHRARPNIVAKYEQQIVWQALLKEYKTLEQTIKKI